MRRWAFRLINDSSKQPPYKLLRLLGDFLDEVLFTGDEDTLIKVHHEGS